MEAAYEEVEHVFKYDYVVLNDEVETAVKKIEAIVDAERCKVSRQLDIINKI